MPAAAENLGDLYSVTVPYAGQNDVAFREAMRDVLVRDVALNDPRVGDILVIPATGAYAYAMANNYNAVPRPPVIFCRDGDARVVVRRETYEDLTLRDR